MKYQIVLLQSTVNVHELRISELEDKNQDLESERYSLSIEMKLLKTLCEQKLFNIESENRSTDESEKIKKMVCYIIFHNLKGIDLISKKKILGWNDL